MTLADGVTEVPGEEDAGQAGQEGTHPVLLPALCQTLPCLSSEPIPRIPATPPVGAQVGDTRVPSMCHRL